MKKAYFDIVEKNREKKYILIRDLSNEMGTMTITNDAEGVIQHLFQRGLERDWRVFYIDSDGRTDQLVHNGERFVDFAFGGPN